MNQFEDELIAKGAAKRLDDGTLEITDLSALEQSPFYRMNSIIVERYMTFQNYPNDYILETHEIDHLTNVWMDWVYRKGQKTNAEDQYKDLRAIGFLTPNGDLSETRVARAADYIWPRITETPDHEALVAWVKKDMNQQITSQGKSTRAILKKRKIDRKRRKIGRRKR